MGNIIKKIGAFSLGPIVGAVLGLVTVPLITYFISPEEYGRASMFTLAQGVASMLVYFGLDQAFVREFHIYKKQINYLLSNAICIPICFVLIAGGGIIICRDFMSQILFGSTQEHVAVYMLAVMLPFMVIENFAYLTIRMQEKGLQYSFSTILLKLLVLIITVVLFISYEKSFRSVVYAMALAEIINGIFLYITVIHTQKLSLRFLDAELIKKMLKFGLPLIPAMIMSWILASMDKVMLRALCGYEQLGLYTAAYKIVSALAIVQTCFTLYWTPVAYRWNESKVKKENFEMVNIFIAVGMSVLCVVLLLLKNLVGIFLGNDFLQAIRIFPFLLLYPVMYTMSETTAVGIGFSRKTYYSIFVSAVACIVNIVCNFIFIPIWGGTGAAFATGISFIIFFWVRTLISRKVWWKFSVRKYIIITLVLLLNCYMHTYLYGMAPYILSFVSIIFLGVMNYRSLKWGIKQIKKYSRDNGSV